MFILVSYSRRVVNLLAMSAERGDNSMIGIDFIVRLFDRLASVVKRLLEALTGEDFEPDRLQRVREVSSVDPRILVRHRRMPRRLLP